MRPQMPGGVFTNLSVSYALALEIIGDVRATCVQPSFLFRPFQRTLLLQMRLTNVYVSSQNRSLKYLSPASGNTVTITPDSIFSATLSAHASAAPDETPTSKPSCLPSLRVYS